MINNIRHLRYVVAVARADSLQGAAHELLISESALSTAIKSVESEIGYSIFVRRPARALTLSRAGMDFVTEAQAFLETVEAFQNRIIGLGTELEGTVRLAAASSFAATVLPPVLKAVRARHPNIDVQVAEYEIPELLKRLRDGDVDLALTYDYLYEADVEMRRLVEVTPHIGVSAEAGYAEGQTVSLHDFAEQPLILIDQPVTKQHVLSLITRFGIQPRIAMYPKSVRLLSALVSDGFGYSIYFLKGRRRQGDTAPVVRLHLAEAVDRHNVVLALPRRRTVTARTRAVAEISESVVRELAPAIVFAP